MSSKDTYIEQTFKPTYLYIKQHSITGLKYFGKTTKSDPIKYFGSGTHWQRHIKKHGKEYVKTLWYHLFENKDDLVEFALFFSEEYNIVESSEWANLKPENGLDGATIGEKNPSASKRMKQNNPMKKGITNNGSFKKGDNKIPWSDDRKQKLSKSISKNNNHNFNNPNASAHLNTNKVTCKVCGVITNKGNIARWHTDCQRTNIHS